MPRGMSGVVRAREDFLETFVVYQIRPTNLLLLYFLNWEPLDLLTANASFVRLLIA